MVRFLYVIIVLMVLAVGWQGWSYHQTWSFLETESLEQSYGATPDKAHVTIIAFINYASRPSKDVNATVMETVIKQPDTRVIFHPIPSSQTALKAAAVALAAGMQHKFIAMHEELMRNEKPLTDDTIREMAGNIKIDPDQLLKDSASPEVAERLRKEVKATKALKIKMSPLFIINHKWIFGPNSLDTLSSDLLDLIQKARAL